MNTNKGSWLAPELLLGKHFTKGYGCLFTSALAQLSPHSQLSVFHSYLRRTPHQPSDPTASAWTSLRPGVTKLHLFPPLQDTTRTLTSRPAPRRAQLPYHRKSDNGSDLLTHPGRGAHARVSGNCALPARRHSILGHNEAKARALPLLAKIFKTATLPLNNTGSLSSVVWSWAGPLAAKRTRCTAKEMENS